MMLPAVYFLLLPGVNALDISGPAEALRLSRGFDLHYISPETQVTCSTGMVLSQLQALPQQLPAGSILLIPGVTESYNHLTSSIALQAQEWLSQQQSALQQQQITLVCICAGALLAAQAGLLNGYTCTTHHHLVEQLRLLAPQAEVKENRIFVEDRSVFTSAGITAGIDLALHLIGRYFDQPKVLAVAREMVVYFRRSGDDNQISPWLRYRNHLHPAVHRAQDLLAANPEADWSILELSQQAHISSRHLARLFRSTIGISVREYHEQLRLVVAAQRLQQGYGLEKAALAAGFSSGRQLRRAQQRNPPR